MAYRRKTWREKRELDKPPKRVRLGGDFAGIPAGQLMLVATPRLVDDYLRRIPRGEVRSIERLRRELARRQRCDATCPVSLSIFLRICAEAAWEELEAGASIEAIAPFWRVIEPDSKIARKLRADPQFIARQRELEGVGLRLGAATRPGGAVVGARRRRAAAGGELSATRSASAAARSAAPGAAARSRRRAP